MLTGAGERAFCAGGDVKERAETGGYGETEWGTFEIERLHRIIRDIPKPVIAAVNGIAIGGGHVLHVICDLSIAAEHATIRAGRAAGRFVRRRVRQRLPGPGDRREAGPADVVPAGPDRRRDGRALGPGQRRRAGRRSCCRPRWRGVARSPATRRPRCASSSIRSTPTATQLAGISNLAFDGLDLFVHTEGAEEGAARSRTGARRTSPPTADRERKHDRQPVQKP